MFVGSSYIKIDSPFNLCSAEHHAAVGFGHTITKSPSIIV
jgi:hypothetical protein